MGFEADEVMGEQKRDCSLIYNISFIMSSPSGRGDRANPGTAGSRGCRHPRASHLVPQRLLPEVLPGLVKSP